MEKEYENRIEFYKSKDFKNFLSEKNVLDSWQYLRHSMLCLNYALLTQKMYSDASNQARDEGTKRIFHKVIDIMNSPYEDQKILNKFMLEWFCHISNSMDCLLQYINAALVLGVEIRCVCEKSVSEKLEEYSAIKSSFESFWFNPMTKHIRAIYNYSKHTMELYGNLDYDSLIANGQHDIVIPTFIYKKKKFEAKSTDEFFAYYEEFLQLYASLLDCIYEHLRNVSPVQNRWFFKALNVNESEDYDAMNEPNGITLFVRTKPDSDIIQNYYVKDPPFINKKVVEVMPPIHKHQGQYPIKIKTIDILCSETKIGYMELSPESYDNSALSYHKYDIIYQKE